MAVNLVKEDTWEHFDERRRMRINREIPIVSGPYNDLSIPAHLADIYNNHLEALQLVFKEQSEGKARVW